MALLRRFGFLRLPSVDCLCFRLEISFNRLLHFLIHSKREREIPFSLCDPLQAIGTRSPWKLLDLTHPSQREIHPRFYFSSHSESNGGFEGLFWIFGCHRSPLCHLLAGCSASFLGSGTRSHQRWLVPLLISLSLTSVCISVPDLCGMWISGFRWFLFLYASFPDSFFRFTFLNWI